MAEAKAVAATATAATPSAGMAVGGTNPVAADGVAADPVATNGQATESKKGGGGENDFIVSTAGNLLRYSVHFLSWAGDAIGEPIQSGAKANEEEEEAGEEEVEEVEEVDGEGGIDRALADVGGEGVAEGERGGGGEGGGGGRAGGGRGRRSRGKTRKEPRGSSPTVAVDAEAQSDPPLLPVGEGFIAFWLPLFLGVLALTTITNFSAGLNTGFHLGARSETGGSGHVTVLLEKCERGYFPGLRPRFRYFIKVASRTPAVSSTNSGSMLIFASCVVGTCSILFIREKKINRKNAYLGYSNETPCLPPTPKWDVYFLSPGFPPPRLLFLITWSGVSLKMWGGNLVMIPAFLPSRLLFSINVVRRFPQKMEGDHCVQSISPGFGRPDCCFRQFHQAFSSKITGGGGGVLLIPWFWPSGLSAKVFSLGVDADAVCQGVKVPSSDICPTSKVLYLLLRCLRFLLRKECMHM